MACHNFWEFHEDFFREDVFSATAADNAPFLIHDTSAAGAPTYALNSPSDCGELAIAFDTTAEAQVICLYQNDLLQMAISKLREVEFRVKQNQATINANSSLTFGVAGARSDTIASIAGPYALFELAGSNAVKSTVKGSSLSVAAVSSSQSLSNVYKRFTISFANGLSDVRFFVDGVPINEGTKFDMSDATGSVQLYLQWQKASNAEADGVTIDYIHARGIRYAA